MSHRGALDLRLRPLRIDDEGPVLAAHRAMAADDGFTFAWRYEDGMPWSEYLDRLESFRGGMALPDDWVPTTFLVAEAGGGIVGRVSIRHRLNESLAKAGGHIGYGVLAEHRRAGYATEMVRQALVIARAAGVDRVLVTCDDTNRASQAVIERCGGVLESVIYSERFGAMCRRYWID